MATRTEIKTKELVLRNGETTLLDAEDYYKFKDKVWSKHSQGYAVRSEGSVRKGTYKQYLLHREIVNAQSGEYVDHINRNCLDNRKDNLRVCSNKENVVNSAGNRNSSSRYKGVSWYDPTKNWTARIKSDNKLHHLGRFNNEEDAAKAYDKKAKELFGEYAFLNFPENMEKKVCLG